MLLSKNIYEKIYNDKILFDIFYGEALGDDSEAKLQFARVLIIGGNKESHGIHWLKNAADLDNEEAKKILQEYENGQDLKQIIANNY